MTRKTPFTPDEIALAEKLFARAKTTNTLKPPRAIAALALSNGFRQSVTASEVTYRDYLRDARRVLAAGLSWSPRAR